MKKIRLLLLRNSILALTFLMAAGGSRLMAQTAPSAAATTQGAPVPSRITAAIDETQLVAIKGSVHPLARPEFDQGAVPDSTPMNRMLLFLQRSPEQEAALQQLMAGQMSKASPNFQNWLTPAQFGTQFGPADADIQTITGWLSSQGFQNIKVGTGRLTIEFSGNVGLVRNAFHTEIHRFVVNDDARQANVSDPMIPAALTPVVAGIVSLHNFPKQSMRRKSGLLTIARDSHGTPQLTGPPNCGTPGNPACFYGVAPADFATIYNIPAPLIGKGSLDGSGSKIAIIGFSNINVSDIREFRTIFGLPTTMDPVVVLNGPDPGIGAEEGEADLDVEWSGAVAPQAEIDFIVSEDTLTSGGLELSSLYVVDNNTDDIMSLSFGACEAGLGLENPFLNGLWEQAAAQGITVTVSAGDPGSAGCDNFNTATVATTGLAVNGLASTPFNIAVGGTDFDDVGTQTTFWNSTNAAGTLQSVKGYIPETTWNDSCAATATAGNLTTCANPLMSLLNIVGGSGGPSTCGIVNSTTGACVSGYPKPSWQVGNGDSVRDIPDVSLFASDGPQSRSFYPVCEADQGTSCSSAASPTVLVVGGTSASAPSFAGIMALVGQSEFNAGRSRRQGNANFVLYKIANTAGQSCNSSTEPLSGSTCAFNDVTKGNNSVPCAGTSLNCSSKTGGTNGVLVEPSQTTTPAWTTTAGYDLATGLGSVNVANLVTAWGAAVTKFIPTTTVTMVNSGISPVTITHGQSVTLKATVTSTSGSPTGDVSFLVPTTVTNGAATIPNSGLGPATLSGGSATLTAPSATASALPGGTYNLKAHYAGDGAFAPSDDPTGVPITVNKEASRLQYGIVTLDPVTGAPTNTNATSVVYGSPYILRIDILNSTSSACQAVSVANGGGGTVAGCAFDATGTVTITDNGSPLDTGTFTINSQGHAEDQPIQLSGGANTLSATYSGDVSYNPVTTPILDTVAVSKATTQASVTFNPSTGVSVNTQVNLIATVTAPASSGAGPTGTVTFTANGTAIGTAGSSISTPFNPTTGAPPTLTAALTTSFGTAGTQNIVATYGGDTNYTGTSGSASLTVAGPDFTLAPQAPASVTVNSGSSATYVVAVGSAAGFSSAVSVSCSLPAAATTCAANPASVAPGSNTTIMVTTTAHQVLPPSDSPWRPGPPLRVVPLLFLIMLALLMLVFAARTKRLRFAISTAVAGLIFFLVLHTSGCGGGSSPPPPHGTQAGTYTVTITGTSGTLTHTTTVTLTVN